MMFCPYDFIYVCVYACRIGYTRMIFCSQCQQFHSRPEDHLPTCTTYQKWPLPYSDSPTYSRTSSCAGISRKPHRPNDIVISNSQNCQLSHTPHIPKKAPGLPFLSRGPLTVALKGSSRSLADAVSIVRSVTTCNQLPVMST